MALPVVSGDIFLGSPLLPVLPERRTAVVPADMPGLAVDFLAGRGAPGALGRRALGDGVALVLRVESFALPGIVEVLRLVCLVATMVDAPLLLAAGLDAALESAARCISAF